MTRRIGFLRALGPLVLITLELLSTPSFASKRPQASKQKTVAQRLVEEAVSKHPEVAEVELAVRSSSERSSIADSELKRCWGEVRPRRTEAMRTGEPFIEKESDGFDVTMPLHDSTGKIIGTVGMDFKTEPGQQRSSVVERSRKIVQEVEEQIPSEARLFEPVD